MKLEVLIIVILCTTEYHTSYAKVNGDLLKVEVGGSGTTDYDTLTSSIKKIGKGSKKQVDDTESSGEEDLQVVQSDNEASSGDDSEGSTDDGSAGSGDGGEPLITTVPPTFKVSTVQNNSTSPKVVVINSGTSTEKSVNVDGTTKPIEDFDNGVEVTALPPGAPADNVVNDDVSTGQSTQTQDEGESGVNFTVAIIVGVVVGAVLSILIIVFLVYRLRKKDEGSYSLDEQSSAMLQTDMTDADSPTPKGKGGEYYA